MQTCSACHPPQNVLGHHLNADGWSDLLNKMISYGAQGSDDQFTAILQYLTANFGPIPDKVDVNKESARNLREWLNLPQKQADAIVAYRQQNGDFKSLDDLKKVPGVDAKILDAQKDHLTF